jgi:DtxR family transcriptional regulator, Mn-dependent transcriptional regulator
MPVEAHLAEQVTAGLEGLGAGSRYLSALLEFRSEGAAAAAVARSLDVTRPSAGETLERLRRRGLVERRPDKTYALTASGTAAAREAVRRRRTVECFLADFVGYPTAAVRDLAQPIANALSDDTHERLFQRLGAPARCPHGRPIDSPSER